MRSFALLMAATAILAFAGFQIRADTVPLRVLRWGLFIGAGIFAALLVSAMLQALFGLD